MPSSVTRPPVSGTKLLTAFMKVVLPAPFGPIRPMISPCSRVRSTPSTALTPSKWTRIPSATSFIGAGPSTALFIPLVGSAALAGARRLTRARAAVPDVRDRLDRVCPDLLVHAVREQLDRVGGRLGPVTLRRELHLAPEVVDHEARAEERLRD